MAKEWKTFADARKTMTELLQGAFAVGFVAGFQQGKVPGGDPTEINLEKKLWRMGKAEAKKCDLTRFGD